MKLLICHVSRMIILVGAAIAVSELADARAPGLMRRTPKVTNYGGGGGGGGGGCTPGSQTFTSGSGNFTVPAGCTNITIEAWGGGAGGTSATHKPAAPAIYSGGSGGGSGGYALKTRAATPSESIAYSVGAGGPGGIFRDGSTTTADVLSAGGGTASNGGTASGGDTNTTGNAGVIGATGGTCISRVGGNGGDGIGGAAGGAGGGTTAGTVNGGVGAAPGAGGGGGGLACVAFPGPYTGNGGAGAAGQVKFTWW